MRKRSRRALTKYVPQTNSKRGIIDLLEVIETDFNRVLSETKAEEAQQASEYARVMADLKTVMERMDKVVHDTGSAKDQKEYIRDNTQAQRAIPGVPFPYFQTMDVCFQTPSSVSYTGYHHHV